MRRHDVTHEQWASIRRLLPGKASDPGRTAGDIATVEYQKSIDVWRDRMRRRGRIRLIAPFYGLLCALSPLIFSPPTRGDGPIVQRVAIAKDGDAIIVPVTINGEPLSFILDTAMNAHLVDVTLADRLPKLSKRGRLNGLAAQPMYSMRDARIGQVPLETGAEGLRFDMSRIRRASGHDVYGFVGMPLLSHTVIRLDFERGELTFGSGLPKNAGHAFDLSRDQFGRPTLAISVSDGESIPFLIDTGAIGVGTSLILPREYISRFERQGVFDACPTASWILNAEGRTPSRQGWLRELSIGSLKCARIGVGEGKEHAIGLYFLSKYLVTFDFAADRMYLEETRRSATPDPLDASGLHIIRLDGHTTIESVDAGSPADKVGLRSGERIRTVDQEDTSGMTLFQIRLLFAHEGITVHLGIDGVNGQREIDLTLHRHQRQRPTTRSR